MDLTAHQTQKLPNAPLLRLGVILVAILIATGWSGTKAQSQETNLPPPGSSQGIAPSTPEAGASPAPPDAICIHCSEPDATYACRVTDTSASPTDARVRLFCISEVARSRGHASCSATRQTGGACAGDLITLSANPNEAASTADGQPLETDTPTPANQQQPATAETLDPDSKVQPPPGTMLAEPRLQEPQQQKEEAPEEQSNAVESALKSAGGALNSAGQAVTNTAKKSWSCVTSFFNDC